MKSSRAFKQFVAFLLCLVMICSYITATALPGKEDIKKVTTLYDISAVKPTYITQGLALESSYPGGLLVFPVVNAELQMEEFYGIEIYRLGGTLGETTVTIESIDYTAQYGIDYEFYLSPLEDEKPVAGEAAPIYAIEQLSYIPTLASTGSDSEASLKNSNKATELYSEYVSEFNDLVKKSSTFDINFANGENSKMIYIRTIQDSTITDDLEFTISIKSATGLTQVSTQNTIGFSITENREKPPAYLEIFDTYLSSNSKDGYITVKRTGNTGTISSYRIVTQSRSAKANEDYTPIHLELDFLPGMTEHKIPFSVLSGAESGESFTVLLENVNNAIAINDFATVTFGDLKDVQKEISSVVYKQFVPELMGVRDKEYVPISEFDIDVKTNRGVGNQEGKFDIYDNYANLYYTNKAASKNNGIAIKTKEKINFAGVESITWYIDNYFNSCSWDHNAIYVSDEAKFDTNSGNFDFIYDLAGNGIGDYWKMTNVSESPIKRTTPKLLPNAVNGEHFLYIMLHKGGFAGEASFKIYSEGKDSDYNITLNLMKYKLNLIEPDTVELFNASSNKLNKVNPTSNVEFVHPQTSQVSNKIDDFYRNENIVIKSTFISEIEECKPTLVGVKFCSIDGKEQSTMFAVNENGALKFTPEIIEKIQQYIYEDNNIYIKPVYNFKPAEVSVMKYNPTFTNSNGQTFTINDDGYSGSLYVGSEKIGTISWSNPNRTGDYDYMVGDSIKFVFTPEGKYAANKYDLDLKYFVGNTQAEVNSQGGNIEGGVAGSKEVIINITNSIAKIYPIVTELDLGVALQVKNPSNGDYIGKNGPFETTETNGYKTIKGYTNDNGEKYDFSELGIGNILTLTAKPNSGYRAKWSYIDTFTGDECVYYGNSFFFAIQNVVHNNVNVVSLEFEKIPDNTAYYTLSGVASIQKSTILNPALNNMQIYENIKHATLFIGDYRCTSDESGKFTMYDVNTDNTQTPAKLQLVGDEIIRVMAFTNQQYYISDLKISDCNIDENNSCVADLKINYSINGPFPEKIVAVDSNGEEQTQTIILAKGQTIKFGLNLNLSQENIDKPVNAIKWYLVDADGTVQDTLEETYLLNGADYTEFAGVMSELANHGQSLWVELLNVSQNSKGEDVSVSFGKFETGYVFQAASLEEAIVYTPDIGVPSEIARPVPCIGPVNPTVSLFGLQPIFNVGSAGEDEYGNSIKTITIGISLSAMNDFMKDDKSFSSMTPLDKAKKLGDILGSYDECYNSTGKFPKFAGGEGLSNALKMNTAVNFTPSVALCFQANYYVDSETSEWKFISTVYVLGFGGKLSVNIPFVFFYIPCFTNITVELSLDICLCVQPNTVDKETGRVIPLDIDNLWDPNMSAMAGVYKIGGSITFGLGIGFNGVISASGNLKTSLNIEFNSFNTGKGTLSMSGGITVEFLFLKYSWSDELFSVELFNSIDPQKASYRAMRAAMEKDIMNSVTLRDMEIEAAIDESDVDVDMLRSAILKTEHIISESPAMVNPSVIEIDDGIYLATMVIAVDDEETGAKIHKMYYFIYNENIDSVIEHGFVIDKYLEDLAKRGLRASILDNLDSDVQMIDCGDDILISWTKLGKRLTGDSDNLDIVKNIGIATLYYNKESGEFHDYSIITSGNDKEVFIRPRIVYDAASGLSQLFYEKLDVSTLTLDSTMAELQELPTTLCMRYNVLNDLSYKWSGESDIAISDNALKYFDVSNIAGKNVLAFVGSDDKGFVLEDASEYEFDEENISYEDFNTKSKLYIQQFYLEEGAVVSSEQVQITDDESVVANPRFAKVRFNDIENLLLFFKHNGDYAYQNINNLISQGIYENDQGEHVILESYLEPSYIEYDEELSVNDDLIIISDENVIYALWTTTEGEQQQIMARSMSIVDIEEIPGSPKVDSDGNVIYDENGEPIIEYFDTPVYVLKGNWGGRTYLTEGGLNNTQNGMFKKDFDAVVTKSGDLLVVFNAYDIDYSQDGEGFTNNNVVVSIYDTASKYVINDSMGELAFSNNYPTEGETVKVQALVTNTGVLSGKNVKVELFANGEKYAENIYKEWLTAETKTVEFYYSAPYGVKAEDIKLSIVVSEDNEIKCKSSEYAFKSGDYLEIQNVMLLPIKNISSDNKAASYKVVATVKNVGNENYTGGKYLTVMDTDWYTLMSAMNENAQRNDPVVHRAFGGTSISEEMNPGEELIVTYFTNDIPIEVFQKNAGGTAAYLEHYIIDENNAENTTITANEVFSYESLYYDGLTTIPYELAVKSIKLKDIDLRVGEIKFLEQEVSPKNANTEEIVYSSSDENVATVNSVGVVTAISKGECTITATASNGVSAIAKITIIDNVESGDVDNFALLVSFQIVIIVAALVCIKKKNSQL